MTIADIEIETTEEIRLALEDQIYKLAAEVRRLRSDLADARQIAEDQVDNTSLWVTGETPREEQLSKELARLHMALKVGAA